MTPDAIETAAMIRLVARWEHCAQVRFGDCATVVTVRVTTDALGMVQVAQSHWIRSPSANRSCRPQRASSLPPRTALAATIGALSREIRLGLSDGFEPDDSWFVPTLYAVPDIVSGEPL